MFKRRDCKQRWKSIGCGITPLAVAFVWLLSVSAQKSAALASSQEKFPYTFSNLVWWTDAELRTALKKRIPELGDDLQRNSALERRVRATLVELLRQKGISAEVQSMEPSLDVAFAKRVPGVPPPSIIFSVAPRPAVLIDRVIVRNLPASLVGKVDAVTTRLQGQRFDSSRFWLNQITIQNTLAEDGYLSASVLLAAEPPRRDGDQYLVNLDTTVTLGPQYHVALVDADGGLLTSGKDLTPYFSLKPGDIAQPAAFDRLISGLRSLYWSAGYADVAFKVDPALDVDHAMASYHLEVVPGSLYHLSNIGIEHLTPAQESRVRELLGLKQGDVYNQLAVATLASKIAADPVFAGYGMSYKPRQDKERNLVDLSLSFYKQ